MRVLVGSIGHESNTFAPLPTTLADFEVQRGADILDRPVRDALSGIVDTLRERNIERVPTLCARALPGGRVERRAYEELKRTLLANPGDVDGVCLFLHGAMRADGIDYCESDLLAALRIQLGSDVPIAVALDMHANIVAPMIETADALVTYHTAPHVDRYETGQRAAELLVGQLEGAVRPAMAMAKIPFLLPGEMAQTALEPMASMMGLVQEIEAGDRVLSASLVKTHCWADVPDQGVSAVVVTDGDAPLAQTEANRLASAFWARRHEFRFSAESLPIDVAIEAALEAEEPTVFLSDSGDNPGAGGTTDVPAVTQALLEARARNAVVAAIWDPESVDTCMSAGVGQTVSLALGGKINSRHGPPVPVTGRVCLLSDGRTYRGGERRPEMRVERGPIAVLSVEGVDIVLSRNRISVIEPAQLHSLGIDPLGYKVVVLKRGYLTAPLAAISPRSILVLSPGPTNCNVDQLPYQRVRRPMYPLDPDATWAPE
jgi:microcystin degradation protein MlrC